MITISCVPNAAKKIEVVLLYLLICYNICFVGVAIVNPKHD